MVLGFGAQHISKRLNLRVRGVGIQHTFESKGFVDALLSISLSLSLSLSLFLSLSLSLSLSF